MVRKRTHPEVVENKEKIRPLGPTPPLDPLPPRNADQRRWWGFTAPEWAIYGGVIVGIIVLIVLVWWFI